MSANSFIPLEGFVYNPTTREFGKRKSSGFESFGFLGGLVKRAVITLTDAQIRALPTIPITLVEAPGAGKMVNFISAIAVLRAAGGGYDGINVEYSVISISFGNNLDNASCLFKSSGSINDAGNKVLQFLPAGDVGDELDNSQLVGQKVDLANCDNIPLKLLADNNSVDFGGGHVNNTLKVTLYYTIVDL